MLGVAWCVNRRQVEKRPAVAARAIARELVLVTVQSHDAAEVDHTGSVTPQEAQGVS